MGSNPSVKRSATYLQRWAAYEIASEVIHEAH